MCVRLFHWGPDQIYSFFNMGDPRWPNLPPPPNPEKLQQFIFALVDVTIEQKNKENSPDGGKAGRRRV